jgi:hypothetical protein
MFGKKICCIATHSAKAGYRMCVKLPCYQQYMIFINSRSAMKILNTPIACLLFSTIIMRNNAVVQPFDFAKHIIAEHTRETLPVPAHQHYSNRSQSNVNISWLGSPAFVGR